jgi:hypothetical protein
LQHKKENIILNQQNQTLLQEQLKKSETDLNLKKLKITKNQRESEQIREALVI